MEDEREGNLESSFFLGFRWQIVVFKTTFLVVAICFILWMFLGGGVNVVQTFISGLVVLGVFFIVEERIGYFQSKSDQQVRKRNEQSLRSARNLIAHWETHVETQKSRHEPRPTRSGTGKMEEAIAQRKRNASGSGFLLERLPVSSGKPEERKTELEALIHNQRVNVRAAVDRFSQFKAYVQEKLDWSQCSSHLPEPRSGHTATPYGQTIAVIGGPGELEVLFLDAESLASGKPRMTGLFPGTISDHCTARIGNKFYVVGGYINSQLSSQVFIMTIIDDNVVHWSRPRLTGNIPTARVGHTLSRYNYKFLLFGGFDGRSWLSDVYVLDPGKMTWSALVTYGEPPFPRAGHSATVVGDSLIIMGGHDVHRSFSDVHVLHLDTAEWENVVIIGVQPPERSDHEAVRVGDNVLIIAGRDGRHILRDQWVWSDGKKEWTKVAGTQLPPRYGHTLCRVGHRLLIFGGMGPNSTPLDDIWGVSTVTLPVHSEAPLLNYGDLKLGKEIGAGNFSKVVRGMLGDREVAVKKITRKEKGGESEQIFKAEVEIMGSLRHPNVVVCYGYTLVPMCIIMELLPCSLYDYYHSQIIHSALLLQFAFDIARGMSYLHSRVPPVIHRDLKSSNLLLDKHLNVKIGDLGIARHLSTTQTMTTIGTVAWTAPEILRHDHYTTFADVYSFGIVLWELIAGKEPYEGMNPMNAGIAVASSQLRPIIPEFCDSDWAYLMQWCWNEAPDQRPTFDAIGEYLKNTF